MSRWQMDWRWLGFQVGVPLVAPALLAAIFVAAWATLDTAFVPKLNVILDLTPWAIAVYSLTLIGATFDRSWSRLDKRQLSWLWIVAATNAFYYALLVIRRHHGELAQPAHAYYVTVVLMVVSIIMCYRAR